MRCTHRLAAAGVVTSVGSTGDSYDNTLAEAFESPFRAEPIRHYGPFKSIEDQEIGGAGFIDLFNLHRRAHGEIGPVPPVVFEDVHYHQNPVPAAARSALSSLQ